MPGETRRVSHNGSTLAAAWCLNNVLPPSSRVVVRFIFGLFYLFSCTLRSKPTNRQQDIHTHTWSGDTACKSVSGTLFYFFLQRCWLDFRTPDRGLFMQPRPGCMLHHTLGGSGAVHRHQRNGLFLAHDRVHVCCGRVAVRSFWSALYNTPDRTVKERK